MMQTTVNKPKKVAIVGLPNTGKSQIFTNLTSEYSMSANYPFTTLEMKKSFCTLNGIECEVIDTPGLHCLYIHSEEEVLVRDMLFTEKPDVIIQCIDANQLKQSLTLTMDLIELGLPLVISLNAIDETARRGTWIDSTILSRLLGVPVVESVAINRRGIPKLKDTIWKARKGKLEVKYGELIEDSIAPMVKTIPKEIPFKRKLAILFLQKDPFIKDYLEELCDETEMRQLKEEAANVHMHFRGNMSWHINNKKYKCIDRVVGETVKKHQISLGGISQTVAGLSRHPVFGLPIFLVILLMLFLSVVNVANVLAGWMNTVFWLPIEGFVNRFLPSGFWNDFLIGDYGVLTLGVSNALLTVLPILSVFFILFNMLEDSGYMPNLCVLMKRMSEKVGLTGNAIMPVTLAFGCKTMATLTTKCLRSSKEKFIAVYLIAFGIPCAAQMALNMSILGRLGIRAFMIAFFFLGLVWVTIGLLLNRLLKDDLRDDFIQDLPGMRVPNMRAVLKKTFYKLQEFLKEAMPIFVSAAVFLFVADKTGVLTGIKNFLRPVITGFLGFPLQMVDVLVLCMAKHEAAAGMLIKFIQRGELTYVQCIVAVTLTMMFVPCLANIMAMVKEQGVKKAVKMVLCINVTAILLAGLLNWLLAGVAGL